jgi:hypothetical protein
MSGPLRIADLGTGPMFDLTVDIPRPGHDPARIRFTCRYRWQSELKELAGRLGALDDARAVSEVITGWDLADEFNAQNIRALCETLPGAGYAIVQAYMDASFGTRRH